MDDLFERIKNSSWWKIVKSLPLRRWASSTKWGLPRMPAAVVNVCLVVMVTALCIVYIRSRNHEVNLALVGLIATTITVVVAIPANSAKSSARYLRHAEGRPHLKVLSLNRQLLQ